jgi:acetyltransferase-like isoleucine patch superfamily enzyme
MWNWADLILAAHDRLAGFFRTASAASQATLGQDCIVFSDGRIVNLVGKRDQLRIGNHSRIRGEILTFAHEGQINIGDWFYCGPGSRIWSSDKEGIRIGSRVLFGPNVQVHDTNSHPMDAQERFKQSKEMFTKGHPKGITTIRSAPIVIGDDVWLGMGAIVLKGVNIGARAIIGAGSVICADVAADTMVPPGTVLRTAETG